MTADGRRAVRSRPTRPRSRAVSRFAAATGLTSRGRALVAAGAVFAAVGLSLGQQSVLRVAVLVLALPLLSLALAALVGTRTVVRRTTTPARAVVGQPCRVRLDLRNPSPVPTPVLLAQDELPAGWTSAPRFSLEPLAPGGRAAVAYTASPPRRGRHRLGPLRVRVTDPLGLCALPARAGGHDEVLVLPAHQPLPGAAALLASRGGDDAGGSAGSVGGEQGMGTRPYAPGDDVRRVHWRSTARRGELMVRQEEQPRQRRGVVVLDRREGAFPAADDVERAVTAAASLGVSLADAGAAVRLELGDGAGRGPLRRDALLEVLALVEVGDEAVLAAAVGAARGHGEAELRDGVLVAVLGRLARADAALLVAADASSALRPRGAALAVLAVPPAPGAVEVLAGGGWTVLDLSEGEPLAGAWQRASDPLAVAR